MFIKLGNDMEVFLSSLHFLVLSIVSHYLDSCLLKALHRWFTTATASMCKCVKDGRIQNATWHMHAKISHRIEVGHVSVTCIYLLHPIQ